MLERRKSEKLADVLLRFMRSEGLESPLGEYRVIEAWPQVAGAQAAKQTTELYIRRQTLFVRLAVPALRTNLMSQRALLVRRLNDIAGVDVITDLRML